MGVLKHRTIKRPISLHESSREGYDRHEADVENDEDDIEETDDSDEGGQPPPRRKHGRGAVDTEDAVEPVEPSGIAPIRPSTKENSQSAKRDKVRLSADIHRDLHTRLRIHSIRSDKSIIQVIEGWIKVNCPE